MSLIMSVLDYLKSFGEEVLQSGSNLFALANGADKATGDAAQAIINATPQLYLKTAGGSYLDRWAWDLLKMRRKPLESDESLRARLLASLYIANGTRWAIKQALINLLGTAPIEIWEPVRDGAFFNCGYYMVDARDLAATSDQDGITSYCARVGVQNGEYSGYIKIRMPGGQAASSTLAFYDGGYYGDADTFIGYGGDPSRLVTIDDVCGTIAAVKQAGTAVYLELI